MKKTLVRVGVIGTGVMGSFHVKQYAGLPEVELVGIFDGDRKRAAEIAGQYKTRAFDDHKSLISEVDALTIAVPTSLHYQIGMECLDKGRHILIEKPIAVEPDHASALIKKAESKRLVLTVGHIERFNPAYRTMKGVIKGLDVDLIDAKRLAPYPERITDASVVLDMMIHDIDLAFDIAGSKVANIKAEGRKVRSKSLDKVIANVTFENGIIATIEADRTYGEKVRQLRVSTPDNSFNADLLRKSLERTSGLKTELITVKDHDSLQMELKNFINAIEKGFRPEVTGQQALEVLKVAKAIEEAAS